MRRTPIRHSVKKHKRKGKTVNKYMRGKGTSRFHKVASPRTTWRASNTKDQRRKDMIKSMPKSWSRKKKLRRAAERMQRIVLDTRVSKKTKVIAGQDYDYYVEKHNKFQNPIFSPAQKAMAIGLMEKNSNIGRSVDHTFRDFEKAHRAAEDELRSGSKLVNMENIMDHMRRRFGFVDLSHGTETSAVAA